VSPRDGLDLPDGQPLAYRPMTRALTQRLTAFDLPPSGVLVATLGGADYHRLVTLPGVRPAAGARSAGGEAIPAGDAIPAGGAIPAGDALPADPVTGGA
jgi:hypothetical protein